MSLSAKQKEFIVASQAIYGVNATITREEIDHVVETLAAPYPHWLINKSTYRVGRGSYLVPTLDETPVAITLAAAPEMAVELISQTRHFRQPKMVDESAPTVPEVYADYVPFGFHKDLVTVVKSNEFYPVFITGLSGNGKTLMAEQVCAQLKRECIRVNVSVETDESDLIGSNTLIDGNVVFRDGPVITAMKRGAILLCLEKDEEVKVGSLTNSINTKLSDMEIGREYPIISYNLETSEFENDIGVVLAETDRDDLYVVEFDDGTSITMTSDHPVIISGNHEKSILDGLSVGEFVVSL